MNVSKPAPGKGQPDIDSLLREKGIYPTAQRLSIAKILFAKKQHVTAEQLHKMLLDEGIPVAKATVYNTLNLLTNARLLNEIFIDASCTYYDTNIAHHHHFFNVDTGELIDIDDDLALQFNQTILPEGTSYDGVDIVIRVKNQAH